eukprot:1993743-Pyramimonas_sp.AAC.1
MARRRSRSSSEHVDFCSFPECLRSGSIQSSNFESKSIACLSRSRNSNLEPQAWNQDRRVSSMYFVGDGRLGAFGALLGRPGALLG